MPHALLESLAEVEYTDIADVARVKVLLASGDACDNCEYFQVFTDAEINPLLFAALRDNMAFEPLLDIDTKRVEFILDTKLARALGLALADAAMGNLSKVEINIMILIETDNDETLVNKAIRRVQDGHYITLILRIAPCH